MPATRSTVIAFLALTSGLCQSEEIAPLCQGLLNHGINTVQRQSSDLAYLAVAESNYCGSSYKSLSKEQQASFNVVVEAIPLGARGRSTSSETRHEQFCKSNFSLRNIAISERSVVQSLHNRAIASWEECVRLAAGQTYLIPTFNQERTTVDVSMTKASGQAIFQGVDVKNMKCSVAGRRVGPKERIQLSSIATSLRCEREPKTISFDGRPIKYYEPVSLRVKTDSANLTLYFDESIEAAMSTTLGSMNAKIAHLQQQIAQLATTGVTTGATVSPGSKVSTGDGVIRGRNGNSEFEKATCPPGMFVHAVQVSDRTREDAQFAVLSLKVDCRALAPEAP